VNATDVKEAVREKYSAAAQRVSSGGTSRCGPSKASSCDAITSNLYDRAQTEMLLHPRGPPVCAAGDTVACRLDDHSRLLVHLVDFVCQSSSDDRTWVHNDVCRHRHQPRTRLHPGATRGGRTIGHRLRTALQRSEAVTGCCTTLNFKLPQPHAFAQSSQKFLKRSGVSSV